MLCVESFKFLKVGGDFLVPYGFKPQTVVLFLFLVFSDFYRLSSHKKIQIQIFANEKFQIFKCQKHVSKKVKINDSIKLQVLCYYKSQRK